MRRRLGIGCLAALLLNGFAAQAQTGAPLPTTGLALVRGWRLQSSEKITAGGAEISMPPFSATAWQPTSMPSTVLAALVANKVYPDPTFGMNLRSIPGTTYPIGRNFSALPMPDDSPFRVPWWYREEFRIPTEMRGHRLTLHFDGINYRANIWLNGEQIATSQQVAGTYRLYDFDITDVLARRATASGVNALAIEIFPPTPEDLAWTWVDWNPAPPDKNMGLWRGVSIRATGAVDLRAPHVVSHVKPDLSADLAVSVEAKNLTARPVRATVTGRIGAIVMSKLIALAANETATVRFTPDGFSSLHIARPRLWWPVDLGTPELYSLSIDARIGDVVSDREDTRFGIREITSDVSGGARTFSINGRPILIRGGGWAPDLLLRTSAVRQRSELAYVRDMHLNTIRLEGKLENDEFFDLADEYGILILAGWCCCDRWEQWPRWSQENHETAEASQHDQICRLRNHPSVLAWMNGSDNPPPADVEKMYVDTLKALDWPNPYISSATAKPTTLTGASGVKMTGPYDWVPPSYWLLDPSRGGAHGFNSETSPGAAVPPIESLRRMLPADHLWPIDDVWNFHAGGGQFKDLLSFSAALNARYGAATNIEDYAFKSQLMTYESERAMFEAYARNTPKSTGVIQWMLNNAWPSMIWHLYDYYLQPGGGYFGAKKANEPLHVQYSYDDRSVVVVNTSREALTGATVIARVVNLDGTNRWTATRVVSVPAGGHEAPMVIPELIDVSATYFVDVRLNGADGKTLSTNLYWLSTKPDVMDWQKSTWYNTPVTSYADFTALRALPPTSIATTLSTRSTVNGQDATVTVTNRGSSLAFFLRLQLLDGTGQEILPVLWEDNYISLWPGESRTLKVSHGRELTGKQTAKVTGWNVTSSSPTPSRPVPRRPRSFQ